jgi:D-xylose 1-dehydrogenase
MRVAHFFGEEDAAGAGAEDGLGVNEGVEGVVEAGAFEVLEEGGGLAAGDDEGVEGVELAGLADERGDGSEGGETVGVDVECALQSEDADGWGFGIHSLILVHSADCPCRRKGGRVGDNAAMSAKSNTAVYPSLENRVVLVTGGATGIGEAIVEAFVRQRARVAFVDIKDDAATDLVVRMEKAGLRAPVYFHCDVTSFAELQRAVDQVVDGCGRVDVLVNNVGNDARHSVESVTPETWDEVVAVNLKQQFFMAQAVAPSMRQARRGSIINMGSIAWVIPSKNVPVYVTAKSAIVGLTRALAHEFGEDEVRVNCVMPGAILTERQKQLWLTEDYVRQVLAHQSLKRMILPEEVARLVLFLAADDSSAITNQSYVVDGGWV